MHPHPNFIIEDGHWTCHENDRSPAYHNHSCSQRSHGPYMKTIEAPPTMIMLHPNSMLLKMTTAHVSPRFPYLEVLFFSCFSFVSRSCERGPPGTYTPTPTHTHTPTRPRPRTRTRTRTRTCMDTYAHMRARVHTHTHAHAHAHGYACRYNAGEGGCFMMHYDTSSKTSDRELTAILYLNDGWEHGDGGELRSVRSRIVRRDGANFNFEKVRSGVLARLGGAVGKNPFRLRLCRRTMHRNGKCRWEMGRLEVGVGDREGRWGLGNESNMYIRGLASRQRGRIRRLLPRGVRGEADFTTRLSCCPITTVKFNSLSWPLKQSFVVSR
jgi:hypothetical protein